MPRDESAYLLDLLLRAHGGLSGVGRTYVDDCEWGRWTRLSGHRLVETVGETVRQISAEVRQENPEIPLPKTVGIRNRLKLLYFDISLTLVWNARCPDIPVLNRQGNSIVPLEA